MATKANQRNAGRSSVGGVGGNSRNGLSGGDVVSDSEGSGDALGFLINIIALFVIVLLVALMSFIYLDILTTKHEVREQVQAMDRLRKEVEKSKLSENDKAQ